MNKGAQTSEFKLTVVVVIVAGVLVALSLAGVVSLDRLRSDVPVAVGIVVGAYNLARGITKAAEAMSPYTVEPKDDGDGGAE